MARVLVGSLNIADSSAAAQLLPTEMPRVAALSLRARSSNTAGIYLADNSAAKSSGFEMLAGDSAKWTFGQATVRGTSFWVWGADSGDRLDYAIVLED